MADQPVRPGGQSQSISWWAALAFGAVAAVALKKPLGRPAPAAAGAGAPPKSDTGFADETPPPASSGAGRDAKTPSELPARGWLDIGKRVYAEIGNDRVLAVAAGVTFYALLAIFPAIVALVSLYGLFADAGTINDQLAAMKGMMPDGALEIVGEQVKRITAKGGGSLGFGFVFGLGTALWSANAGMKAVFDALNIVYDEKEKRGFFMLNATSLAFTVGAILFLILALVSVVVVPVVLNMVGLGAVAEIAISLARWPLLLLIIVGALAVLYRYGPSRERAKWSWVSWGSGLAAIGWIVGSMLFSWYVGSFGNYNETYGSLGAAIGFMTWIWLSSTIVLVGGEVNAEMEHQTAQDTTKHGDKPMGARGAAMADEVA